MYVCLMTPRKTLEESSVEERLKKFLHFENTENEQ